jgi:DNA-binding response OmpR family regulator
MADHARKHPARKGSHAMRIMIAHPDPDIHDLLQKHLAPTGLNIDFVHTLRDSIRYIARHYLHYGEAINLMALAYRLPDGTSPGIFKAIHFPLDQVVMLLDEGDVHSTRADLETMGLRHAFEIPAQLPEAAAHIHTTLESLRNKPGEIA